jgi:long-chain fatty acid transport protein
VPGHAALVWADIQAQTERRRRHYNRPIKENQHMQTASSFTRISALAIGIVGVLALGQAHASGFQLREQSVKNLGRSNAGSAVMKDDASTVSLNPAAMSNIDKNTVQADVTMIDLDADFSGGGQVLPGTPLARPVTGGNGGDPGDETFVPNMAAVFPMHGALEGMTVGVSVGAPFGLKTEYEPGWVGRYKAQTSDLKTVDLTMSASFEMSDGISVGLGLIYERAEATLTKAIDFGTLACATAPGGAANCSPLAPFPFKPQNHDGLFEVEGDSTSWGAVIGAQIAPSDKLAIGVSYRTEISHDIEGTLDFDTSRAPFVAANPRFANGSGGAQLTTPSILTASIRYGFTDDFRILADFQETGWSSLEKVEITRTNGTIVGSEDFSWEDTTFLSVGLEYDISDAFTLRGGVAQDESPTNDKSRTPRLPDEDRMLYSIGMSWNVSEAFTVDAAFQRINIDDPTINLPADFAAGEFSSLNGTYSGSANLIGVSAQYRF